MKERAKRKDAYLRLLDERQAYAVKYPVFRFKNADRADPEFVESVRDICNKVDFDSFEPQVKEWYAKIKKEPDFLREFYNYGGGAHPVVLAYMFHMGEYIYQQFGPGITNHVPFNDIRTIPLGPNIQVRFNGLRRDRGDGGTIWHSSAKPTIKFGKNEYVVGFTFHAIQQTMTRLAARPYSYAGAGDIFAYFDQCRYYEPVWLPSGEPAFSIWDQCSTGFFSWSYVNLAFGRREEKENNYYRRVGYCPVVFENGYAKAKTLLPPGYRNTPEEKLLRRLRTSERGTMKALVEKPIADYVKSGVFQIPANYFDAIKFFHQTIPQVMQTDEKIYERD